MYAAFDEESVLQVKNSQFGSPQANNKEKRLQICLSASVFLLPVRRVMWPAPAAVAGAVASAAAATAACRSTAASARWRAPAPAAAAAAAAAGVLSKEELRKSKDEYVQKRQTDWNKCVVLGSFSYFLPSVCWIFRFLIWTPNFIRNCVYSQLEMCGNPTFSHKLTNHTCQTLHFWSLFLAFFFYWFEGS